MTNTGPTPVAHMTPIEESEILSVLNGADHHGLKVTNVTGRTFEEQYCGHMVFDVETDIGVIRLSVFNDCDEWDYVEEITVKGKVYKCSLAADPMRCYTPLMTRAIVNWHPRMENAERWGGFDSVDCDHWF